MSSKPSRRREEPDGTRRRRLSQAAIPIACALLPGFLAGIQLAGLLFFLNPHWPFEPAPLVRTVGLYSVLLAIGSSLVLLPFTWRQPRRAARLLPWSLCLVFALAGITLWVHASRFSLYLPAGINRRLIKAALWLSLAGVVAFYTALLHSLHSRPYGRRSRLGLAVLALLVSYTVFERREAYRPDPKVAPRPSTIAADDHPSLLVVGIEGLTLDVVLPLAEQGELPFFAQVRRQGSAGRLAGIRPSRRMPSWATLATGKFPFRHGTVGDLRYSADFVQKGLEFRLIPIGLGFARWGIPGGELPGGAPTSEGSLSLWEILAGLGIETAVVDWPGAGPGNTAAAGATLLTTRAEGAEPAERDVSELPAALQSAPLADQRAFGRDLERVELARQWLGEQRDVLRVGEAAPRHDGLALFLSLSGALDVSRETFGAYSEVQFDGLLGADREAEANRLRSYYAGLDAVLRDLWQRLPEPRLMVVVSPYGVRTRKGLEQASTLLRPRREFSGKTSDAPDGAFLAYGEAVEPGRFLTRLESTDLTPTVLYGAGFPSARDLDGTVRTEVFRTGWLNEHPLTYVPSYETAARGGRGSGAPVLGGAPRP